MGLDGGTIPTRTDLLRGASWALASKDESRSTRGGNIGGTNFNSSHVQTFAEKAAETRLRLASCAISRKTLTGTIHGCCKGNLYNLPSLHALLHNRKNNKKKRKNREIPGNFSESSQNLRRFRHIRVIGKDTFEVKGERVGERGGGGGGRAARAHAKQKIDVGMDIAPFWQCPITGVLADGKRQFVALSTCGHVFSLKAVEAVVGKSNLYKYNPSLKSIQKPYNDKAVSLPSKTPPNPGVLSQNPGIEDKNHGDLGPGDISQCMVCDIPFLASHVVALAPPFRLGSEGSKASERMLGSEMALGSGEALGSEAWEAALGSEEGMGSVLTIEGKGKKGEEGRGEIVGRKSTTVKNTKSSQKPKRPRPRFPLGTQVLVRASNGKIWNTAVVIETHWKPQKSRNPRSVPSVSEPRRASESRESEPNRASESKISEPMEPKWEEGVYVYGVEYGNGHISRKGEGDIRLLAKLRCPSKHRLSRFLTDTKGFECNLCRRVNLPEGHVMHGCRTCDWDACHHCFQKYNSKLQTAQERRIKTTRDSSTVNSNPRKKRKIKRKANKDGSKSIAMARGRKYSVLEKEALLKAMGGRWTN
ncbi:hypothetical protein AAMO2058_000841100 [Amorphochlora amoebiformis]